jgi:hypothetical protein
MEALIESIRTALAPDASTEARASGAEACRTILTALKPAGEAAATTAAPAEVPIATILDTMRGIPADQLLDLAIAKLRAALPPGTQVPAVAPLKFNLVAVPRAKK